MENESMPPVVESKNPNHVPKAMLWVVIVAIIAIALIVLMVFWMNKTDDTNVPSVVVNNNANEEMVEQEVTPDDFKGWSEYIVEKSQQKGYIIDKEFSIKIPSDWQVENNIGSEFIAGYPIISKGPEDVNHCSISTPRAIGFEGTSDYGLKTFSYKDFSATLNFVSNGAGRILSRSNINGIELVVAMNEANANYCQDVMAKIFSTVAEEARNTTTTDATYNGWKEFKNEEYGYSIKYPEHWNCSVYEEAGVKKYKFVTIGTSGGYSIYISAMDNPDRLTAQQWVDKMLNDNATRSDRPKMSYESKKTIAVGSKQGYEIYKVIDPEYLSEMIFLAHGDHIYRLYFPAAEPSPNLIDPVANNAMAHKIIQSIKFFN